MGANFHQIYGVFSILILSSVGCTASRLEAQQHTDDCRDRFLWPFDSSSIWNTAIGSEAVFVDASLFPDKSGEFGPPAQIHNDQEFIILTTSTDPLVDWMSDAGNFPGGCDTVGDVAQQLPLPVDFVTDCVANNNGAGVLLPDNETLVQMQPLYRSEAGGPFVAWWHEGAPQPFPWNVSILEDDMYGAHGGSGLSSFGGSIRLGELLESSTPISHALKLEFWGHAYYYYNYTSAIYESCYTWPAIGCDSYYNSVDSGAEYEGTNAYFVPGALLAVSSDKFETVNASLTTVPGIRILQALVDYGGYIVDDTASQQNGAALCMDSQVTTELQDVYGYSVSIENPLTATSSGKAFYEDLVTIFRALSIVINNGPDAIGGGGVPRISPPPPICGV